MISIIDDLDKLTSSQTEEVKALKDTPPVGANAVSTGSPITGRLVASRISAFTKLSPSASDRSLSNFGSSRISSNSSRLSSASSSSSQNSSSNTCSSTSSSASSLSSAASGSQVPAEVISPDEVIRLIIGYRDGKLMTEIITRGDAIRIILAHRIGKLMTEAMSDIEYSATQSQRIWDLKDIIQFNPDSGKFYEKKTGVMVNVKLDDEKLHLFLEPEQPVSPSVDDEEESKGASEAIFSGQKPNQKLSRKKLEELLDSNIKFLTKTFDTIKRNPKYGKDILESDLKNHEIARKTIMVLFEREYQDYLNSKALNGEDNEQENMFAEIMRLQKLNEQAIADSESINNPAVLAEANAEFGVPEAPVIPDAPGISDAPEIQSAPALAVPGAPEIQVSNSNASNVIKKKSDNNQDPYAYYRVKTKEEEAEAKTNNGALKTDSRINSATFVVKKNIPNIAQDIEAELLILDNETLFKEVDKIKSTKGKTDNINSSIKKWSEVQIPAFSRRGTYPNAITGDMAIPQGTVSAPVSAGSTRPVSPTHSASTSVSARSTRPTSPVQSLDRGISLPSRVEGAKTNFARHFAQLKNIFQKIDECRVRLKPASKYDEVLSVAIEEQVFISSILKSEIAWFTRIQKSLEQGESLKDALFKKPIEVGNKNSAEELKAFKEKMKKLLNVKNFEFGPDGHPWPDAKPGSDPYVIALLKEKFGLLNEPKEALNAKFDTLRFLGTGEVADVDENGNPIMKKVQIDHMKAIEFIDNIIRETIKDYSLELAVKNKVRLDEEEEERKREVEKQKTAVVVQATANTEVKEGAEVKERADVEAPRENAASVFVRPVDPNIQAVGEELQRVKEERDAALVRAREAERKAAEESKRAEEESTARIEANRREAEAAKTLEAQKRQLTQTQHALEATSAQNVALQASASAPVRTIRRGTTK